MTEQVQIALIAAMPPTIVAVTGFVIVLRKVKDVHLTLNSRLTQLVEATRLSAFGEGVAQERDRNEGVNNEFDKIDPIK
jgi:hypothetical protein